jgi:cytochrome bd ubiquinol oxidase subunit II
MSELLPILFALTLGFAVYMYVIADGFDLGIGILFPLASEEASRAAMMSSIAPVWDGNETWLVLGGTLLIAAFPLVYAVALPAFYVPVFIMLFALVLRGVAFEFRFRASRWRFVWDWAFSCGSFLAALMQGAMLGAFIQGIPMAQGRFAGDPFSFLSGFSVACAAGVAAGYTLLGANWLILKTSGATQQLARRAAPVALLVTLAFIVLISAWIPLMHHPIARRWLSPPNLLYVWLVPVSLAALAAGIWRSIHGADQRVPFVLSILLFLVLFVGLGISLWPYAIPYEATVWEAASSVPTLIFLGVGTVIVLPVILGYLGYAYWVFRGKVRPGSGYSE